MTIKHCKVCEEPFTAIGNTRTCGPECRVENEAVTRKASQKRYTMRPEVKEQRRIYHREYKRKRVGYYARPAPLTPGEKLAMILKRDYG